MDGLGLFYKVQKPVVRVSQCLRNSQNVFLSGVGSKGQTDSRGGCGNL